MTPSVLLQRVWPIILANAAVPLLGFTDTFIIGNARSTEALAALGISVFLFNLIFWSFGFLRMSTTAQVAQSLGANDRVALDAAFVRALLLALSIAFALIILSPLIQWLAFKAFSADVSVETLASRYFDIRIFGAPATLTLYTLSGLLIGLGHSQSLLKLHAGLTLLNALLDVGFVMGLGWGIEGVALGTVIAEYTTCLVALYLLIKRHKQSIKFNWTSLLHAEKMRALLTANGNLLLRTWALLFGFFWFIEQSTTFGTHHLAATHLLLQMIFFSALVLDAFAYIAESETGKSIGKNSVSMLKDSTFTTTLFSMLSAILLALFWYMCGPIFLAFFTPDLAVLSIAISALGLTCTYILLSFMAFQLDGIFIGASLTSELRNASVLSFLVFVGTTLLLVPAVGYSGLWLSFILYICVRAITLMTYRHRLLRLYLPNH